MPSPSRWGKAQAFERSYWEHEGQRIRDGVLSSPDGWYRWKAGEMEKLLAGLFPEQQKRAAKVLEIGCGPVGIVSLMGWGERHALDPLDDFYRTQPEFSRYRDPAVRFQQGTGERLPFEAATFDLVILENVLDHVQAAHQLLQEVHRVLAESGLLYFVVNVRTPWGTALHSLLSFLLIDPGHPYSFTASGIRRLLAAHGFEVRRESLEDAAQARDRDCKSSGLKDRIKGYSGLTEFVFSAICARTATS